MSGGPTTGALSTLPAHSHFAAIALAIPISRAWSRSRMTPTLRSRRSSSSPSHSRTDLGQPCTAAPWRGGTARVNGIARPSRNGRCQSSRRRGRVRGAARAPHRRDTPSGIASGSLRAWFATANATSRKTRAGWRSLLRTSARPSPWRCPQASGLASVFGTRRCTKKRVPSNQRMETTP